MIPMDREMRATGSQDPPLSLHFKLLQGGLYIEVGSLAEGQSLPLRSKDIFKCVNFGLDSQIRVGHILHGAFGVCVIWEPN